MEESVELQRKIIGLLIRAAREKRRRSVKEVGQRIGVSGARIRQFEAGEREVTLPELETLALYFRVPLSYFLNPDSSIDEELAPAQSPDKIKSVRALIAERLKQARTAAGKSREECAEATQIKPSMLSRYERGVTDIPITDLERLAKYLKVDFFYFLQSEGGGGSDLLDLEKLARLPQEVRAFVLNIENVPYLRLAQKFHSLPADKLKEMGEILLIVR